MKALPLFWTALLAWTTPGLALEPIADQELAAVTGQEGVSLGLRFTINTDNSGTPLATLDSCSGTDNPCRLAIQYANRTDKWLVFKDYYGMLNIPSLLLDASSLSSAGSDTSYFDASRFKDSSGTCLLAGGCTTENLETLPALALSFPGNSPSYSTTSQTSSGYTSLSLGLTLGRLAVEHGATAYAADVNGSFLGLRIADTAGGGAQAAVKGRGLLFGF